ncbi:ABC transporter ATP-binding protein [Microvirga rosea]|uniref:ABC transporter ATP-binding protein n=1 Tax=Microvirga rosea TaxID=2715425 RepID=UPI001D0BD799|nr:ABC transporter ATP-binding protein [Microvirga rosea]MCB8820574.1 ABC transporter ATP-binding protein [Microvirga rosea]
MQEPQRSGPLLQVTGLKRYFGSGHETSKHATIKAVEDVTFQLRAGETLGLVGESGCGKSTTGRMIVGLEQPTTGAIAFRGQDLSGLSAKEWRAKRRELQIVFQNPQSALDPRLSVRRQIREPLDLHRIGAPSEREAAVTELMEAVSLPHELGNRFPHEISGGQAQRVVIARALTLKPSLIVCDEPVSALDVSVQAKVVALLEELQARLGVSYLFISHDLRVVKMLSHRVAVMYLGQIVEEGLTDELYDEPLHPYTKALLSAIPDIAMALRRHDSRRIVLQGDPPSPAAPPAGCHFHTRCPFARERCRHEMPALRAIAGEGITHKARCHFAEELKVAS